MLDILFHHKLGLWEMSSTHISMSTFREQRMFPFSYVKEDGWRASYTRHIPGLSASLWTVHKILFWLESKSRYVHFAWWPHMLGLIS